MYKLILGNVRVTVIDDTVSREQAADIARKAIATAGQQGKLLSHIEVSADDDGIQYKVTEKSGSRLSRKTLKQSMLDSMYAAVKEKLYPSSSFSNKDTWFDGDTGQEWHGGEIDTVRSSLLEKFEEWKQNT